MEAVESELKFKIQWHVGQYTYKFTREEFKSMEEFIQKKFPGKDLVSYEKAVCDRFSLIENRIDFENFCPAAFSTDIMNLIKKIRRRLADFAKNPCDSYPFFVTKDNYFYALLN